MDVKASNQITIMKVASDDITVGCRNLIRNSTDLIYQDYYFAQDSTNSLESHSMENPQNEVDTCAKFTIDDATMPFNLNDITTVDEQYTLSFWVKSDNTSSVKVYGVSFVTSSDWKKYSLTFSASDTKLDIYFAESTDVYYIYHPKLEIGNIATDWTPAPEDMEDTVSGLTTRITTNETSIEQTSEAITLLATKSELAEGLENCKRENSAELQVTADGIRMEVSEQVTELADADSELLTLYNEIRMNYDFTAEGQFIGKKDSDTMMKLVNDMLQILISGNPVTALDTNGLTADMANIEMLRIGDYSLTKSADGHLRII